MRGHPYRHSEKSPPPSGSARARRLGLLRGGALIAVPIVYVCFDAVLARTTVDNVRLALFVLAALFGVFVGGLARRALFATSVAFVIALAMLHIHGEWTLVQASWSEVALPALAGLSALMALVTAVVSESETPTEVLPEPIPIELVPDSQRPLLLAVRRRRERFADQTRRAGGLPSRVISA